MIYLLRGNKLLGTYTANSSTNMIVIALQQINWSKVKNKTMIPEIKEIQDIQTANPIVHQAIRELPERIKAWEDKVRTISPFVEIFTLRELHPGADGCYIDPHHPINQYHGLMRYGVGDEWPSVFAKEEVIFKAAFFGSVEQWIAFGVWPDSLDEDDGSPLFLEVDFKLNDRATVGYADHAGTPLWENPEFTGTWSETYQHLCKLTQDAIDRFNISKPWVQLDSFFVQTKKTAS